jgi:6-phosphogluconolactonase
MNGVASVHFEQVPDADAVARRAADRIRDAARAAIGRRGRFRMVLAGGTTPLAAYRLLAQENAQWGAWEVWFGDERCLPPGDPDRNSRAAHEALLGRVPIPRERIHPIPAELGPEAAATAYAAALADALPFDLVLLGMGEDGHTASLFPGHPVPDGALAVAVRDAPKPPPERVSLTPLALGRCREMLVLVTGTGKREALAQWRAGADLPVARAAEAGRAQVLLDRDAAGA